MVWGFPISCLCTYLVEKLIQILRTNIVSDYADDIRCGFDIVDIFYIYIYTHTHINLYYRSSCLLLRLYLQFLFMNFFYLRFVYGNFLRGIANATRDDFYIYFIYILYYIYIRVFLACLLCAALSRK